MGLDMYLSRVIHPWMGQNPKVIYTIKGKPQESTKVSRIVEEGVYWRKANQIHHWFVENVQDGEDDCGTYSVEVAQLNDLVNLCKEVLENPQEAEALLPTESGFFFGSTDYDEGYFDDLKQTIRDVEALLQKHAIYISYEYRSSW